MYIITLEATENGGRPALQSWNSEIAPEGYALCPDSFFDTFYSTTPAGFVNIETDSDNVVTAMTVNQSALDAYIASLPEPEPEPEQEDTEAVIMETLIDQELRISALELGV